MGRRRIARELAVQVLFHIEFNPDDHHEAFVLICDHFHAPKSVRPFSSQLVQGVCDNRDDLDALIIDASKNWRLERMARLDKCILRLASFEMLFMNDVPPKVSIDEAVEIGKKFGGDDSGSFINGVLDNIYNTLLQQGKLKDNN